MVGKGLMVTPSNRKGGIATCSGLGLPVLVFRYALDALLLTEAQTDFVWKPLYVEMKITAVDDDQDDYVSSYSWVLALMLLVFWLFCLVMLYDRRGLASESRLS